MGSHGEASIAIDALDGQYSWEGMDTAMVVKWMDAQLQKRRKELYQNVAHHGRQDLGMCDVL